MTIFTSDFSYQLPEDRIALFPTQERDQSKLLVYKENLIEHSTFNCITDYIPQKSLLVFNNTQVIPARLRFAKESGAVIEIFLLNPAIKNVSTPDQLYSNSPVRWNCTIGNKKRWKQGHLLKQSKGEIILTAELVDESSSVVEFKWTKDKTFREVLTLFGDTPLPPYINRHTVGADQHRYQTIYSSLPGAVAAPTAGLHFTSEIFQKIGAKGIFTDFLTLHVGAGTFQPIKTEVATDHPMHGEQIIFSRSNIDQLIKHSENIIPVGTTSCRTLESLYWFGVKLLSGASTSEFNIDQHVAYKAMENLPTRLESLQKIYGYMAQSGIEELSGTTSIYIYPGYSFKMTDGLITNFHQPNSTLLLLIAALVGNDWKKIYDQALRSGYRFLSYGDSSLLFPSAQELH